jgi:hypothetical protein
MLIQEYIQAQTTIMENQRNSRGRQASNLQNGNSLDYSHVANVIRSLKSTNSNDPSNPLAISRPQKNRIETISDYETHAENDHFEQAYPQ